AEAQGRADAGAVVPTGPLPGTRELEPPEGSTARALEDRAIAACGATRADFESSGRDLPGARRPLLLAVRAEGAGWTEEPGSTAAARAVRLSFSLPAGAYATVVADALTGPHE